MTFLVNTNLELVDDLVSSVIKSTRLPVSQITFQNQDIVGFMQEEQQTKVSPMFRKIREDYWNVNYDQTILPNTFSYPMPPRCLAGALRKVVFVDPSGTEIELPHLDPDQIATPSYFAFRPSWQGQGYFIQNDQIVLWPQTMSFPTMKLRQRYERRPNALTLVANCALITAVFPLTVEIDVVSHNFVIGSVVDVISATGQHVSQADGLIVSNVNPTAVFISATTPFTSAVTVGSYLCPAGLTCIPQVPDEAYPIYVGRGVMRIAAALGNQNAFNVGSKMAEDAVAEVTTMLTPRVPGNPKKFVNKNAVGGPYNFPYYR